jgi:hypothetical protein
MRHHTSCPLLTVTLCCLAAVVSACGGDEEKTATVSLKNDFNNPTAPAQPPWTVCHAWYNGTLFDKILLGATSAPQKVTAGLGPIYLIGSWNDPDCNPAHCLPLATKTDEETVPGQQRTIALVMTNHQGPCPPEGVQPIPEALYNKVLALWPEYQLKPYADRTKNPQCVK